MNPSTTSDVSENCESLRVRVERIIKRFGFAGVQVSDEQAGHVTLTGSVDDINDRPLVVAIARTTPGVREVRSDIAIGKT